MTRNSLRQIGSCLGTTVRPANGTSGAVGRSRRQHRVANFDVMTPRQTRRRASELSTRPRMHAACGSLRLFESRQTGWWSVLVGIGVGTSGLCLFRPSVTGTTSRCLTEGGCPTCASIHCFPAGRTSGGVGISPSVPARCSLSRPSEPESPAFICSSSGSVTFCGIPSTCAEHEDCGGGASLCFGFMPSVHSAWGEDGRI